ncbi:testis-specific serine/threonine-protein kinase 6-like [Argopecten irradians]|uniref:testis-specific serine/threonine-protein kinase 6-like n=1 Tax=Argopecten irradians TaxID=31199 RepID=UPI003717A661
MNRRLVFDNSGTSSPAGSSSTTGEGPPTSNGSPSSSREDCATYRGSSSTLRNDPSASSGNSVVPPEDSLTSGDGLSTINRDYPTARLDSSTPCNDLPASGGSSTLTSSEKSPISGEGLSPPCGDSDIGGSQTSNKRSPTSSGKTLTSGRRSSTFDRRSPTSGERSPTFSRRSPTSGERYSTLRGRFATPSPDGTISPINDERPKKMKLRNVRPKSTARQFMHMADLMSDKGYRLGPKIGDGTYATVRVVERESDGTILAVKIVDTTLRPNTSFVNHFLPSELSISICLSHRNAINIHEIIQNEGIVFMIMDYAVQGDLLTLIRQNGSMSDIEARKMFSEIAHGVKYLHENGISHRDIKCENIFLMKDRTPVIGDFGFAKRVRLVDGKPCPSTSFCGSMAYASPQLLFNQPYDAKINDIWSLGCVLYIMMCATMPFDDMRLALMRRTRVIEKVLFPVRVLDKLHADCKNLIYSMLEADTDLRLKIEEVLEHPWLREVT